MKKIINSAIFAGILTVIIFPPQANAYLDPGTGSFVLQLVVGVIFGGLFAIKTFWGKITSFISNLTGGKGKKNSEDHHEKHK